jgi:ribosomal protein S18 acetylase RimI-like enzyme
LYYTRHLSKNWTLKIQDYEQSRIRTVQESFSGFKELKLNKIYLKVNSKNENAIKLYLNTGFIIEGKLEDHYYNTGTNMYEDIICMSLFNS